MIFVSVGTFVNGFDELISAMDFYCGESGQAAFAQIGGSSVVPKHMDCERFLPAAVMQQKMREADLIVCHAGFGVLGEAMRCGKPIVTVPRQNLSNSANAPANNQAEVALRLGAMHGISVCLDWRQLPDMIAEGLQAATKFPGYDLQCNIPVLIKNYLMSTRDHACLRR